MTLEMKLRERENEGIAIGEKRGKSKNQDQIMALFKVLREQNRIADFEKAMTDKAYLNQLLDSIKD